MGAAKTIRQILIDKHKSMARLAEDMGKPQRTVVNTLYNDKLSVKTANDYGLALGCRLYYIDEQTGRQYPIYVDE